MPMSDAPDANGQRHNRIDLRSGADVEHWTKTLGISAEQLHAIVAITGDRARDVEDYLKNQGRPATPE